jgi:anti-sigma factor RsiW
MSPPTHPHLDDEQLNAWLDDALDAAARQRMEAHLRDCAACTGQLAELQALQAELRALPDAPLTRDLSANVLLQLASRHQRAGGNAHAEPLANGLRILTALQLLAAALALAWFAPALLEVGLTLTQRASALFDLRAVLSGLIDSITQIPVTVPQLSLPEDSMSLLWIGAFGIWALVNVMSVSGSRLTDTQSPRK